MTMFTQPTLPDESVESAAATPVKRPSRFSPSNWSVGQKVVAIVVIPTALAVAFGGMRIYQTMSDLSDLRLAADRAELVRPVENYIGALDNALLANASGTDVGTARTAFDDRRADLRKTLESTDVAPDVRQGVTTLLDSGPALLDQVQSDTIGLGDRVTSYAPILLTAEDVVVGSVRVDDEQIRAQAQGVSRAVGARGQVLMQKLLVIEGAELAEPELRTSMITVAGTEPSTLFEMNQVLGVGSPEARTLQQQMVTRMEILSDPAAVLVGNPELLQSLQTTDDIAKKVIDDTTSSLTTAVDEQVSATRVAAIRDAAIVLAAIGGALLVVLLVARALIRPLRRLRAGALRVAHEDLPSEVERIRAGEELPSIEPIPVYTTEEIGQVAHAVDDLHEQALMMAAEQSQLQVHVSDMFETLSRRSRSLVDQQLSLIDHLERDEDDPQRLDALFKLDHLAARMRRNGTNLLVLAGAKPGRDQAAPVRVATIISAAASQVEDYPRVETARVPDSALLGSVAGDVVHLLAELMDNALRYSPPDAAVRVSAVYTGNRGVVIEVSDSGLGMTETDLRIANTRLESGGKVTPHTARHMGLFVVGRLARQHGLVIRLRSSVAGEPRSGTTAGVFIPAELIASSAGADWPTSTDVDTTAPEPVPEQVSEHISESATLYSDSGLFSQPYRSGSSEPDAESSLPRRDPGASGIVDAPGGEPAPEQPKPRAPINTAAFFAKRAGDAPEETDARPPSSPLGDTDVIFQRMLSEWLIDPETLMEQPQSWESVWDSGWEAAEHADEAPVDARTDQGLPVREPGARLVPGAPVRPNGAAHRKHDAEDEPAFDAGHDPEAEHEGGVRAGRWRVRERPEADDE